MTQGVNENKKDPRSLTDIISFKISDGKRKTESLFPSARIFKVPEGLRKLNRSAYTPRIIAIGPLHRTDKHLRTPTRHVKMYYTDYLLYRVAKEIIKEYPAATISEEKGKLLDKCVEEMKACVEEAKTHYAAEVMVNNNKMSEIMLVDGCFILELLFSTYVRGESGNPKASSSSDEQQQKEDPILDNNLTNNMVQHDLLLLENQIPFFVLEKLFQLTLAKIPEGNDLSLRDYVLSYFGVIKRPSDNSHHPIENSKTKSSCCCWPSDNSQEISEEIENQYHPIEISEEIENQYQYAIENQSTGEANKVYFHILHVIHDHYAGSKFSDSPAGKNKQQKKFSELEVSASDLDYAGIKLQPVEKNIFDIKFVAHKEISWWCCRGEFQIPTLNIDDLTEPLFGNLIAFEQCFSGVPRHFTCYANLMDMLIDSEKDVQVLKKAKVINDYLGKDEDVADLFNKLCKEIMLEASAINDAYEDAYQEASKYSRHCWPRFIAFWERTYFYSPWAFIGFCVAFAAITMQFITFVRSFL